MFPRSFGDKNLRFRRFTQLRSLKSKAGRRSVATSPHSVPYHNLKKYLSFKDGPIESFDGVQSCTSPNGGPQNDTATAMKVSKSGPLPRIILQIGGKEPPSTCSSVESGTLWDLSLCRMQGRAENLGRRETVEKGLVSSINVSEMCSAG